LSSSAKFCVIVWRAVCVMLFSDQDCLNVHIWSLLPSASVPLYIITSDAGPWGLGVTVCDPHSGAVLCFSKFRFPFDASASSFQNAREYMGYLFSLLVVCAFAGPLTPGTCLLWRTDNSAAQAWIERNMCSSSGAQSALLAVTSLQLRLRLDVGHVVHIPGVSMGAVDDLSRDVDVNLKSELLVDLQYMLLVNRLFTLCDPTVSRGLDDHLSVFENVYGILDSFLSLCPIR